MGGHLRPRYGQVILVSGYPVLTAVNWSQNWCAICVQYQFSCAPKLARKCEVEHWYACGEDGRSFVRSVYGHVITKFYGMGRFTYPWCSAGARLARESSAIKSFNLQSAAYSSLPQHCTFVYRGEVFNRDHFFLKLSKELWSFAISLSISTVRWTVCMYIWTRMCLFTGVDIMPGNK